MVPITREHEDYCNCRITELLRWDLLRSLLKQCQFTFSSILCLIAKLMLCPLTKSSSAKRRITNLQDHILKICVLCLRQFVTIFRKRHEIWEGRKRRKHGKSDNTFHPCFLIKLISRWAFGVKLLFPHCLTLYFSLSLNGRNSFPGCFKSSWSFKYRKERLLQL